MKKIDTLVDDIFALFDPSESHHVDEKNLEEFGESVKRIVRQRLLERDKNAAAIRFSSLGKPDRQIWYQAQGLPPEEMTSKTFLKFMYGDVIEALLVFLVKESGHVVEHEQAEVEVDGVLGHIDCTIDGVVTDVKSAAPYSYEKFKRGDIYEDVFSRQYIDQLCGYSNVLTPNESPMFLAFDKVSGDICTLSIPTSIAKDYKPEERIKHLKQVIKMEDAPQRCYEDEADGTSGNRKLGTYCSYCAFKQRCYPGLRGFAYSGKPRYLTVVKTLPKVPEFEL